MHRKLLKHVCAFSIFRTITQLDRHFNLPSDATPRLPNENNCAVPGRPIAPGRGLNETCNRYTKSIKNFQK